MGSGKSGKGTVNANKYAGQYQHKKSTNVNFSLAHLTPTDSYKYIMTICTIVQRSGDGVSILVLDLLAGEPCEVVSLQYP